MGGFLLNAAAILALAMQCAPSVHPDTTHDVALTESGFNPLAIGVVGGSPVFPKDLNDALRHVSDLKAKGKNYSVGLMQINQANFKRFNTTAEKLFNPCNNINVYEKIISDCFVRGGTLRRALSCYYSGKFDTGQKPEKAFNGTSYVQRIGYVVPSTKIDKQEAQTAGPPQQTSIIFPSTVIRGSLPEPPPQQITTVYPDKVIRGNLSD